MGSADILVIGAGVSGLTCACRLLQDQRHQHRIRIWATEQPFNTTSAVAAATWLPYAMNEKDERTIGLALETLEAFKRLANETDAAASGIQMHNDITVLKKKGEPPPWAERVPDLRWAADAGVLPKADAYAQGSGFVFPGPVIDMSLYLTYLENQVHKEQQAQDMDEAESGIHLCAPITSWGDVFSKWVSAPGEGSETPRPRVIVNCTGWRAGKSNLVEDDKTADPEGKGVYPSRGQILRVARQGIAFDRVVVDETDGEHPTYMVTRLNDIVLGGTNEPGNDDPSGNQKTRMDILHRCVKLSEDIGEKAFAASLAKLAGGWVEEEFKAKAPPEYNDNPAAQDADPANPDPCGIRPGRGSVRLERVDKGPGRSIIHNYGHGGSGVTLSWGCARVVAKLVNELCT